jgi:nucleoside-diphosphate-sugar epimerase
MKKAVVIGGYGHIGSYLVPELVDNGFDVTVVSRGNRRPYNAHLPQWQKVKELHCDRRELAREKKFGPIIADMQPDLIFDVTSYTLDEIQDLCDPILANPSWASRVKLIQIGTIWVYGYKIVSPVTEDHVHNAVCNYGKGKTEIENYLRQLSLDGKINTTVLHPGHISGEGWYPINPQANFNPQVYQDILSGKELLLPDDGNATIHHVHSADITGLAMACINNPNASCGQAFNATSKQSISLRGFAELMFSHYGYDPCQKIKYAPFSEFSKMIEETDAKQTYEHIRRCPSCSMEKAEKLLGFVPKHSSIDTVISAVDYKINCGELKMPC